MKLSNGMIVLAAVAGLLPGGASACRYNVRDIGFVDLGVETCMLFVFVNNTVRPATVETLKTAVSESFTDTDLRAELVNTDADPSHPAVDLAANANLTSRPAALFVAPDGRCRPVTLTPEDGENTAAALDDLAASPLRQQIAQACAKTYGVVLVIEGLDAAENAAVRTTADNAVALITEHLDYLPKPIAEGPVVVTLPRSAFAQEELLLWLLNLNPDAMVRPHAAVFHGRARQIGPVLKDDEATGNIMTNVLSLIGADCECGLDRRWMEGLILPARWTAETRAALARSLGFDPDSPMVKMEVSMILRKGPAPSGGFGIAGLGDVPFGYQEIEVQFDDANAPAEPYPTTSPAAGMADSPAAPAVAPPRDAGKQETLSLALPLAVLVVSGGIIIVVGVLILWRARKNA